MRDVKQITIINQYIGSPYHGMEYRHYYLARNLLALGYGVTMVSGSYSHLFSKVPQCEEQFTREEIDGIEYIWIKVPKYGRSKSIGRIWNMLVFAWKLRFLRIKASHILVSSPSLFPVKIGRKLAGRFGTKFLFEVRDIWPLTLMELSNLKPAHPIVRLMEYYERFAYRHADKVISLLPTAKEYFVSRGMMPEKWAFLPNGIETVEDDTTLLSVEVQAQIPSGKFIVAYTGTIGIANNLGYLIEAAEQLKMESDIHFVLLGQGGERQNLQERVRKLGLNNVSFVDAVPKKMVGSFLKWVDVAFISLLPEKLFRFGVSPNKVFEYMHARKPIIWAIEAGNNPVEEAQCGVSVPLEDPVRLAQAIKDLYSMTNAQRTALGQNGYNYVATHHGYPLLAEKLKKIIEE